VWWASPWAANFNQRLGALVKEVQASPMSADELDPRFYIAPSVSNEARAKLEAARAVIMALPRSPVPQTLADFDAATQRAELVAAQFSRSVLDELRPVVVERHLNGVSALDVQPCPLARQVEACAAVGAIIVLTTGIATSAAIPAALIN